MSSINGSITDVKTHWTEVILNVCFPEADIALRAGKHITTDALVSFNFVNDHFEALSAFYRRYQVELIRASENFFYLRSLPNGIMPKLALPLLESFLGKLLCLLYFQPEKLNQGGWFTIDLVLEQLHQLVDAQQLFALIHPRAAGSQMDQQKLREKVRQALMHLKRLGFLTTTAQTREGSEREMTDGLNFRITEAIFRFSADVREGQSMVEAQQRLLRLGELVFASSTPSPNEEKGE